MSGLLVANSTLDKGAYFELELLLLNPDGTPFNLLGSTGAAKIRKYPTSPKYEPFSITFINRELGNVKISLTSIQTYNLESGRNYYDMFLTDSFGRVRKVVEGSIIVNHSVTLGPSDSDNSDGLDNIDMSTARDGYVLMYKEELQKYIFVDPDEVLSKSVEDDFIPSEFLEKLDVELDNRIDVDSGDF